MVDHIEVVGVVIEEKFSAFFIESVCQVEKFFWISKEEFILFDVFQKDVKLTLDPIPSMLRLLQQFVLEIFWKKLVYLKAERDWIDHFDTIPSDVVPKNLWKKFCLHFLNAVEYS